MARGLVADFLRSHPKGRRSMEIWVRVNPLNEAALEDLAAILPLSPDGIVLPKSEGAKERPPPRFLSRCLRDSGGSGGRSDADTARGHGDARGRLGTVRIRQGISGAARRAHLGCGGSQRRHWCEQQSLCIGTLGVDLPRHQGQHAAGGRRGRRARRRDAVCRFSRRQGPGRSCHAAATEGFSGRIAIHPTQVETINEAFSPSPAAVEHARRVIAAFAAGSGAGTVGLDGKMLDLPHLRQARAIIAKADAVAAKNTGGDAA